MLTRTIARTRLAPPLNPTGGWTTARGECPDVGAVIRGWRVTDTGAHWSSGGVSGWWVQVEPATVAGGQ